jgi:hypothetical protein
MNAIPRLLRSRQRPFRSCPAPLCISVPKVKGRRPALAPSLTGRPAQTVEHPAPRRDPLGRLLAQLIQRAGRHAVIAHSSSRPWASATFVGAQHRIIMQFSGAPEDRADIAACADAFAHALTDAEFSIPGHIVADLAVDERIDDGQGDGPSIGFVLTALTIEDW